MVHLTRPRSLLLHLAAWVVLFPAFVPASGHAAENLPSTRQVWVLVHGAAGGGWQFKRVAALLSARGDEVHRPTLSGLGYQHHTATASIGLAQHIDDIANYILFEELTDVILVGHSYAGMVVTGVADRMPERIRRVIYLDAFLPVDGESLMTMRRPDSPDSLRFVQDGFMARPSINPAAPPPRLVRHPFKTFTDAIVLRNPDTGKVPGAFILTVAKGRPAESDTFYFSSELARVRGWPVHTMEADHFPMLSQPEALTRLLLTLR